MSRKSAAREAVDRTREFDAKFPDVAAMRGKRVAYFDEHWTVAGPSYRGSLTLIRTERREDGPWLITTYIGPECLDYPEDRNHHARWIP